MTHSAHISLTWDSAHTDLIAVQKSVTVKSADFFDSVILSLFSYMEHQVSYNLWDWILIDQKQIDYTYFANIITKEAWLTLVPSNYFVNDGKYPTFVDLVILNPTITV